MPVSISSDSGPKISAGSNSELGSHGLGTLACQLQGLHGQTFCTNITPQPQGNVVM